MENLTLIAQAYSSVMVVSERRMAGLWSQLGDIVGYPATIFNLLKFVENFQKQLRIVHHFM